MSLRRHVIGISGRVLTVVGVVALIAAFGIAALLLSPAAREATLRAALALAERRLPGEVRVEKVDWETPGALRLRGFHWIAARDTLASFVRLHLDVDVQALLNRRLRVRRLELSGLQADTPAIRAHLPAPPRTSETLARRVPSSDREGILRGLPPLAIEHLYVEAPRLQLSTGGESSRLEVAGWIEITHHAGPRGELEHILFTHPPAALTLGPGSLEFDLAERDVRGELPGTWHRDWPFVAWLRHAGRRFTGAIDLTGEGGPRGPAGLWIEGEYSKEGDVVDTIRWNATTRLPSADRLAAIPGLERVFAAVPAKEVLAITAQGEGRLKPQPDVRMQLRAGSFATLDSLRLEANLQGDRLEISEVLLWARDLTARGSWRQHEEEVEGVFQVAARGVRWLQPFAAGATLPDSLELDVEAEISGAPDEFPLQASIHAWARFAEHRLDRLDLSLAGPLRGKEPLRFRFALQAQELTLLGDGELIGRAPFEIALTPLCISPTQMSPGDERPTKIRYDPHAGALAIEHLQLRGALGDVDLDAYWEAALGGEATLDIVWPEPPALLAAGSDRQATSELTARWRAATPPHLRMTATADSAGGWRLDGRLRLPPPKVFAPLFSSSPHFDDLGSIAGEIHVSGTPTGRVSGSIDLGETDWLDIARAKITRQETLWHLDSLVVRSSGLGLRATAAAGKNMLLEANAELSLESEAWLRRLRPGLPADLNLAGNAQATVSGRPGRWAGTMDLALQAGATSFEVPDLRARADIRQGRPVRLVAEAVAPVRIGGTTLGSVRAEVLPLPGDGEDTMPPACVAIEVCGEDIAVMHESLIAATETLHVWTDTLAVRLAGGDLHSVRPFLVRWLPAPARFEISGCHLEGELGFFAADGFASPERSDLQVAGELRSAADWPLPELMQTMTPGGVEILLDVGYPEPITLTAASRGLRVGHLRDLIAELDLALDTTALTGRLALANAEGSPLEARARLPVYLDLASRSLRDRGSPWEAEVHIRDLPLPGRPSGTSALADYFAGRTPQHAPRLNGRLAFLGRSEAPTASAIADVTFPERSRLRDHRVHIVASLVAPDSLPSTRVHRPPGADTTGIFAEIDWKRGGTALTKAELRVPWTRGGLDELRRELATDHPIHMRLKLTDCSLEDFNAFVPPHVRLGGRIACDLMIDGPQQTAALSGWFTAKDLAVATASGNRLQAGGHLEFAGQVDAPQATGELEFSRAQILIPEPPRDLHEMHGRALLWEEQEAAVPDPVSPESARAPRLVLAEALALGIDIRIPGSFLLRGRGLDVQMTGDLRFELDHARPRVLGELRALRGSLTFLGRRFSLERGAAVFHGGEVIDPELDILLAHDTRDLRVFVRVTGTPQDPHVELSSEPPLEQTDILSHLLFERSRGDLDSEQATFLQSQTLAALRTFAIPQLEQELSWRLGLDIVQLRERSGEKETSSIVLGKYLSPRALLKHDQGLRRGDDFAVSLEYWLTRDLRLEGTSSRQRQSGLRLNWRIDR
jgi:autotransporter translocation and assembly factor TamB